MKKNGEKCLKAMTDIYEGMAVKKWLDKWDNCSKKEKYLNILKAEKDWCLANNISFTPELLINGKSYPKEYNKADLIYFMEDLVENIT